MRTSLRLLVRRATWRSTMMALSLIGLALASTQAFTAPGGISLSLQRWDSTTPTDRFHGPSGIHRKRFPWILSSSSSSTTNEVVEGAGDQQQPQNQYQVTITYCTGCNWGLRAFWMAQELLTTFDKEPALAAVTLIPSRPNRDTGAEGGLFEVLCYPCNDNSNNSNSKKKPTVLWNRKEKGGFPELKDLKQLLRDEISPEIFLGHSDKEEKRRQVEENTGKETIVMSEPVVISLEHGKNNANDEVPTLPSYMVPNQVLQSGAGDRVVPQPHIGIYYCTGCRWLLRAGYVGQELMTTFDEEINAISLLPSRPPAKGGSFVVFLAQPIKQGEGNDDASLLLWDRKMDGGFPKIKILKQRVRDRLNPDKNLGHADTEQRRGKTATNIAMDEEDAEEARRFFGVM